ncbi:FHA domain protein (macronuclear) [Tetrahymena thermophila SB210]|uniref:FHA domain protein n=1 Tax=Tetrahymena thermophila (strain SB210) TaxID=312017 RepID=I7M0W3_TETTS|nr:FHA domain protein [Tetrahymena thermophila SB210]EAR92827.2 FHA domain protein [Tetrahymena thermophila SB210]|eukprot:XP_001013072.2 FHA domain protein [Tetrahymena thermophila SB210]
MINNGKLNLTPTQIAYIKVTSNPNPISWSVEDLQLALNQKIPNKFTDLITELGFIGNDLVSNNYDIFLQAILEIKQQLTSVDKMKFKSFYDELIILKDLYQQKGDLLEQIKLEQQQNSNQQINSQNNNPRCTQSLQSGIQQNQEIIQKPPNYSELITAKIASPNNQGSKAELGQIQESLVEEMLINEQQIQILDQQHVPKKNESQISYYSDNNLAPFKKNYDQNCFNVFLDAQVYDLKQNDQSEEDESDDDVNIQQVDQPSNIKTDFKSILNQNTVLQNLKDQQIQINDGKKLINPYSKNTDKDDNDEEDDEEDDDEDDDDDEEDDEDNYVQEVDPYGGKKFEITPQNKDEGRMNFKNQNKVDQKDEFTIFKQKPSQVQQQAQILNQTSPYQIIQAQFDQKGNNTTSEQQQITNGYEQLITINNPNLIHKQATEQLMKNKQDEEETQQYMKLPNNQISEQTKTLNLFNFPKLPLDFKSFDYTISIQSKDQEPNIQFAKEVYFLKQSEEPLNFIINISRIRDETIKNNYLINAQDCSRNHIQILCDQQYRFYLGNNKGRNGTFIKSREYEEIFSNTELQVGNIFLEFKVVEIKANEKKARLVINAFSINQQEQQNEQTIFLEYNSNQNFMIGRNNSTYFSDLFQKDTQLSRKHGEIYLNELNVFDPKENKYIQQLKVIFQQFSPRNGSWIKIKGKQYIGNDSVIKVGVQNFLQISIQAKKPNKYTINTQQQHQDKFLNLNEIGPNFLLNCKRLNKDHSISENLMGLGCGHTFCKDCENRYFLDMIKCRDSKYLKKICPICYEELQSCSLKI